MRELRVLAFGAWDRGAGYPRGTALIEALRRCGVEVRECHFELPYSGVQKRRLLSSPFLWPGLLLALPREKKKAQARLRRALQDEPPDLVLVPYPGHLTVHWARPLFQGPILLDLFLSAYDTAVVDRGLFRPGSLRARLLRRLDRSACLAADGVLVDTLQNQASLAALLGIEPERIDWVPISDPDEEPAAKPYAPPRRGECLELLFFGTGVPLHGLGTLIEAVQLSQGVRLTLIGGGEDDRARAAQLPGEKIRLLDPFVDPEVISERLQECHLVAGIFGSTDKANRVIPFKVMLALSAGRPVITADTPAVRELLRPGMNCITVRSGDARALAAALDRLVARPETLGSLAEAARHAYEGSFSLDQTGSCLLEVCSRVLARQDSLVGAGKGMVP